MAPIGTIRRFSRGNSSGGIYVQSDLSKVCTYRLSNLLTLQSQNFKKMYLFLCQKPKALGQACLEEGFSNLKSVFEINPNQTKGFIRS